MISPLSKDFPSFNFTTESTGDITGSTGAISETGKALSQDASLELVGGFVIPDGLSADFSGKSLSLRFIGTLDKVPDPAVCVGSGGVGVSLNEVTQDKEGKEQLVPLGSNNTLSMGGVFIPEKGVASDNSTEAPFKKTKILRIQNNSSSAIAANFVNTAEFSFSPVTVNVAPDKNQDVTVSFSTSSKTYTQNDPVPTQDVSATVSVGDKSLNIAGLLKRAGPELFIDGGDSNSVASIDFGIAPAKVNANGTISCVPNTPPVLGRAIKIKNTGIRPLLIPSLPAPVMDDLNDTKVDPYCPSFGSKFQRMSLSTSAIGASCKTQVVNGHTYILDDCEIPPGEGYVQFKAVYIPKNSKSLAANTKDTAKLTIPSNDPVYNKTPFSLVLEAGVSKDTSDLLSLSKVKEGVVQSFQVRNKESFSINIEDVSAANVNQVFSINNSSTDTLGSVKITLSDKADKDHYKICKVGADLKTVDIASCAFDNVNLITQVPAMVGKTPGMSFFAIQLINPGKTQSGPYSQSINIQYVPSSTAGLTNQFNANVVGTVGYSALEGNVQMDVEYLGSFIDYDRLPNPRDSVDFRKNAHVKSGPLRLILTPHVSQEEGAADTQDNSLMDVTVQPTVDSVDFTKMTLVDRKKLIRLPSNSIMTCDPNAKDPDDPSKPLDCSKDNVFKVCKDPDGVLPEHYADDQTYCSYFYYILKNGALKGSYNNETGEMTIPGTGIDLYNPFHSGKALSSYPENYKTNTSLKATFTTAILNSPYANGIDYIPSGGDRITSVGIGPNFVNGFSNPCPADWVATKDYDLNNPKPTFNCFLAERGSTSSPAYIKGYPAVPVPNGERTIALAAVTRFEDAPGTPEYVPFFMNNRIMWIVFQGHLKKCKPDWSDCPIQ